MDSFTATFCFAEDTEDSFKAGLADDQHETSRYVLFERLKVPTTQDLKFGFEAPHFEIDDQEYSGYGLLEKVELIDGRLVIWPNEEGKRVLEVQRSIEVFISPKIDLQRFESVMKSILGEDRFIRGSVMD